MPLVASHCHHYLVLCMQRLAEDRLFDTVPCIIITAKGMPDLATRAFAHRQVGAACLTASALPAAPFLPPPACSLGILANTLTSSHPLIILPPHPPAPAHPPARMPQCRMVSQFPSLVILGLVDFNPAGLTILKTYKYGSNRMGMEAHRYTGMLIQVAVAV